MNDNPTYDTTTHGNVEYLSEEFGWAIGTRTGLYVLIFDIRESN